MKELDTYGYVIYLSTFQDTLPGDQNWLDGGPKPIIHQFTMTQTTTPSGLLKGSCAAEYVRMCKGSAKNAGSGGISCLMLLEDPVPGLED